MRNLYINMLVGEIARSVKEVKPDWFVLHFVPTAAMVRAGIRPTLRAAFFDYSSAGAVEKCVDWLNRLSFKELHGFSEGDEAIVRFVHDRRQVSINIPMTILATTYNKDMLPAACVRGINHPKPFYDLWIDRKPHSQVAA